MNEIENLYRIARNDTYSDTYRDLAARAITRAGRPGTEQTIARIEFGECACGKHVYRAMNGNWYHSDSQPTGTMQLACTQDPANQR